MTNIFKRAAVLAFYDADGIVDDYVLYLAAAMKAQCEKQVIIINGELNDKSRQKLQPFADEIIIKENVGYDVSAYKAGYQDIISQDSANSQTEKYDEVIFYNSSCFGPIYPFNEMFDDMSARTLDFWGVTMHSGAPKSSWDEKTSIPVHIQSYFFAVRKEMFYSQDFAQYWSALPEVSGYWDAVANHEVIFTKHFEMLGYKWDVYVDTKELQALNDYPLVGMPEYLARTKHCPLVKRKSFIFPSFSYQSVPHGKAAANIFNLIKNNTDYDINLITQNLTRTVNVYDFTSAVSMVFDVNNYVAKDKTDVTAVYYIANDIFAKLILNSLNEECKNIIIFKSDALQEKFSARINASTQAFCARYEEIFTTLWAKLPKSEYLLVISDEFVPIAERFADSTSMCDTIKSLLPNACAQILNQNPETGLLICAPHTHSTNLCAGAAFKNNSDYANTALSSCDITLKQDYKKPLVIASSGSFFSKMSIWDGLRPSAAVYLQNSGIREILPPIRAAQNGYITQYVSDFDIVSREMQNQNDMLIKLAFFASDETSKSYDKINFIYHNALRHYFKTSGSITLEQAFKSNLGLKQKLYIIKNLFFHKK